MCAVQTVERLIQQQQRRLRHPRPRQQHAPTLAIGKLEEAAPFEFFQTEQHYRPADLGRLGARQLSQRDIGAIEPRADDLAQAQVPIAAGIAVLMFTGHMQHARQGVERIHFRASSVHPLQSIARTAPLAHRRRPTFARQQFAQLRLAGAIATFQHPAFAGCNAPAHATQYGALTQQQMHAVEHRAQRHTTHGAGIPKRR